MEAKAYKATKSTGSQGTGENRITVEKVSLEGPAVSHVAEILLSVHFNKVDTVGDGRNKPVITFP